MKERLITMAATLLVAGFLVALVQPQLRSEPVQTSARFGAVQFSRSDGAWWFFDTRSGDIWVYDEERKMPLWHFRVRELGSQLEKIPLPGIRPRPTGPLPFPPQARP